MSSRPIIIELSVSGATCFNCVQTIKNGVFKDFPEIQDATFPSPKTCTLTLNPNVDVQVLLKKLNKNEFDFGFEDISLIDQSSKYFKRAVYNAFIFVPLMLFNMLGLIPSPLTLIGQFIGAGLALISFAIMHYSGGEFYKNAWAMFKQKKTNMNTLIALSTVSAWLYSVGVVFLPGVFPLSALSYHFGAISMILSFINLGRGLRAKAEYAAEKEMQDILSIYQKYQPQYAYRVKGHGLEKTPYQKIEVGDILEIKSGERFVTDGTIISNATTFVDQKNISGESALIKKSKGDWVESGTLNTGETVRIKAENRGAENNLTKRLAEVKALRSAKNNMSPLIEKISIYFVPTIIGISVLTGFGWLLFGPAPQLPFMLNGVMSVLLCACPCALGLATPISTSLSIYKLLEKRILVKNAAAFEEGSAIDCVIFDKTGTLTQPVIQAGYFPTKKWPPKKSLKFVASIESKHPNKHPIANAFLQKVLSNDLCAVEAIETLPNGMVGKIAEDTIIVGSQVLLAEKEIIIAKRYTQKAVAFQQQGLSPVYVAVNQKCIGLVALKQEVSANTKAEIKQSFSKLRKMGIKVGLLTGDKEKPALALAQELGFDDGLVFFEKTAQQKQLVIQALQAKGYKVAMVGDGINDLEACSKANLSFAINAWTNAAAQADVSLQGSVLDVAKFLTIAKTVQRNIKQNLGWTFFYNTLSLIAAMGLLYPLVGFTLNPAIASLAMGLSSVFVVANARRLSYLIENVLQVFQGTPERQISFWQYLKNTMMPRSSVPHYSMEQKSGLKASVVTSSNMLPAFNAMGNEKPPIDFPKKSRKNKCSLK